MTIKIRPERRPRPRGAGLPYLLILPCVAVLIAVAGWPLYKIITLSLQKQESGKYALFHSRGTTPYVGLRNFGNVLTDSTFWAVLERTVIFTAVNVALSLAIGMGIAL